MPYLATQTGLIPWSSGYGQQAPGLAGMGRLQKPRGRTFGSYPTRLGQSATTTAANAAGAVANAIVPGSGSIVAPVIQTLAQVFGGNPATGDNAERQAKMYTYYEQAMTNPGSPSSICAVQTLYSIAMQGISPACNASDPNGQQNNPQATRTYAQQVLQVLSTQGWVNVNTTNPTYTGIAASGVIYAPQSSTGQEVAVANAGLPSTAASLTAAVSSPLVLVGGGILLAMLLTSGNKSSTAKAA
jgi:hypothetical protein